AAAPVVAGPVADLVRRFPDTTEGVAALLGCDPTWQDSSPPTASPAVTATATLVTTHPATANALDALVTH
ncbi:MAG: hypothetical protein HOY71_55175, partial [Nonomuraea sp.]|nr:hypothetical protein [Nonomuraea sp.]